MGYVLPVIRGRARHLLGAAAIALVVAPTAQAEIPSVPDGAGGDIACSVQTGANAGERHCSGIFTTFDGAPIDVNIGFPAAPASAPDGNFPIIGVFHGWGGSKAGLGSTSMQAPELGQGGLGRGPDRLGDRADDSAVPRQSAAGI